MGLFLSLFKSKTDTKSLLERIQNEIEDIEEFKYMTSKKEKNCICLLLIFFLLSYLIITTLIFTIWWIPITGWHVLTENGFWIRVLYLILVPIVFFFAKKGLHFYYAWDRDRKEERLRELKKQKRKILEKVRETETYNNAEEILKKYDPKSVERVQQSPSVISPQRFTPIESQLRYRGNLTPMRSLPALPSGSSFTPQTGYGLRPQIPVGLARGSMVTPVRPPLMATPMPAIRTIKPIVAQNRSIVEKVVDYMVGDGPNNRYALICIHCYSHNGMALKDEFEFIAFRCCYCRGFNPARKMRPQPPRLDSIDHLSRRSSSLTPLIDEPESDTDSERGPKIVEKSSRINEVHNQSDNEGQSEDQIDSETKIKTTDVNDSVVHNESNNTQTSVSEKEVESKVNDKHETNSEAIVGKDMPFIDEANDESNDSSL